MEAVLLGEYFFNRVQTDGRTVAKSHSCLSCDPGDDRARYYRRTCHMRRFSITSGLSPVRLKKKQIIGEIKGQFRVSLSLRT